MVMLIYADKLVNCVLHAIIKIPNKACSTQGPRVTAHRSITKHPHNKKKTANQPIKNLSDELIWDAHIKSVLWNTRILNLVSSVFIQKVARDDITTASVEATPRVPYFIPHFCKVWRVMYSVVCKFLEIVSSPCFVNIRGQILISPSSWKFVRKKSLNSRR